MIQLWATIGKRGGHGRTRMSISMAGVNNILLYNGKKLSEIKNSTINSDLGVGCNCLHNWGLHVTRKLSRGCSINEPLNFNFYDNFITKSPTRRSISRYGLILSIKSSIILIKKSM